jgi:ATP-dependent DNA helicase PIF1
MILEAQILTGTHAGKKVPIPRICLVLKTNKNPFVLERRQYPIKICYAMTINKS